MGIEPFLIASIIRVVVGQRLVRVLRPETRVGYTPTEAEKKLIISMFNLQPNQNFSYIHELEKQAAAEGVGGDTPLGTDENGILTLWHNNNDDNEEGAQNGYKGRTGIYEVLNNSLTIQKLIVTSATTNQIQSQAIDEGMTTMQTDGLIKALRGVTTVDEVIRVTKD
jgi:type II secretory ATPase GspE/PulE/Tfp pilus assembly ATPase PilB-like protein